MTNKKDNILLLSLLFFLFLFAIAVRLIYFTWAVSIPEFLWHGTLMINNVDGYYYAVGAKEILNHSHLLGDLNPNTSLVSIITAFLVKITPFSLDEVILWLPAIFGSLVVIPLVLLGKTLKSLPTGVLGALLGSIAWSYYNRTMVGYYDTDMLIIPLLVMIVWGIAEFFVNKNKKMFWLVPLLIIFNEAWYPQCRVVLLSVVFFSFIYAWFFDRKKENFLFLLVLTISLSNYAFYINLAIVILLLMIMRQKRTLIEKNLLWLFGITLLFLAFSGSFNVAISKLKSYLLSTPLHTDSFYYYSTMKTVREASGIPYSLVADRISGNIFVFALAVLGYIVLLIRKPIMIITIPLVVLGIFAHILGLRFTIYAVPFLALGYAYFGVFILDEIIKKKSFIKYFFMFLWIAPVLYVNIIHIIKYKVPTTLLKPEVEALVKLSKISKPGDYAFTWWDYAYPIRYYASLKTVIDGGVHSGALNYEVSYAFLHNQIVAANLARLDVEYIDKLRQNAEKGIKIKQKDFLINMMKKYHYKDPYLFLQALDNINFPMSKSKRNIYFYIPFRMTPILPTIAMFSSIDLKSGKVHKPFIISTKIKAVKNGKLYFADGLVFNLSGRLIWDKKIIPIKAFYYVNNKKIIKQKYYNQSPVSIVFYKPLNQVLIVQNKYLNSTFMKLYIFKQYNKKLFQPIIINDILVIYKLKK